MHFHITSICITIAMFFVMIRGAAFGGVQLVRRDTKEVVKQIANDTGLKPLLNATNQSGSHGSIVEVALDTSNGTALKPTGGSDPNGSIRVSIATGTFVLVILAFIGSLASF
ncbi:hypothetical protein PNEG_01099 [Pneumocystis murina B123]|uniref:Uncharacterized protein n=1 Tax=Pneumocystis murina (strain B123) TaxID=1069680 RepID=M7PKH2_PNEMU|nr:hypothetical protein PNEG_01099 [Pneumocystis murina B123]EMR10954.1 hypothetical protein PNEG_01099 [Pneumocystis murina B123]